MKKLFLSFVFFVLPATGFSESATEKFLKILAETGIVERQPPPTLGELVVNPYYLEDLKKLPPEQKARLADQLAKLTPQLAKERDTPPTSGKIGPLLAILILQDSGTDKQKVEAFQDLDLYGKALDDACRALATCQGNEGVKLLKKYAESQIPGIELEIQKSRSSSNPDEYTDESPPSLKYFLALKALQGAYHSDGPASVSVLRERLINLYGDLMTDQYRDGIRKELEEARLWREKFVKEKHEELKTGGNARQLGDESLDTNSNHRTHTDSSEKWFWPSISSGAVIVFIFGWFFIRRKAA